MRAIYIFVCSILFIPFLFGQVPHIISYQGILTDISGNSKPDGDYIFTFYLYEVSEGGNVIWSETKTLNVSKGLFSTSLGDATAFGSEVKFDKPYWLGIKVGSESEFTPRIALTSSGYSVTSGTTLGVENGVVIKSVNGLKDDVTLEGGGGTTINTDGNKITISSSGSGGTGIQGVQNTNNTLDITNPNGPTATMNVKIPLKLEGSADGNNYLFTANNNGSGHGIIGTSVSGYGSVGIATGTMGQTVGVVGNSFSPDGYAVSGWNLATTGYSIGVVGRTSSPAGIGVRGFGGQNGIGVWGSSTGYQGVYGYSQLNAGIVGESQSFHAIYGVSHGTNSGGVYAYNDAGGTGVIGISSTGTGVIGETTSGQGVKGTSKTYQGVYGFSESNAGIVGESNKFHAIYGVSHDANSAGVFAYNTDPNGWAAIFNGKVAVNVLQINGGSDLAEPFEVSDKQLIEPGTVMIIDENNPGKLIESSKEYDKKVAGIVSGAGGIKPGITLKQDGVIGGDVLIAISGRVYCKAEAFSGPIKPGDLITTSNIPGYAMKVSDRELSQGAIIGKAMTELKSGKGLILILVNLQ